MTDDERKVVAALQVLIGQQIDIATSTLLRDGLGLDSNALVEFTVLIHSMYHIDLGRRVAERRVIPETVADVAALLSSQ
jgi:acyl carrier protein